MSEGAEEVAARLEFDRPGKPTPTVSSPNAAVICGTIRAPASSSASCLFVTIELP